MATDILTALDPVTLVPLDGVRQILDGTGQQGPAGATGPKGDTGPQGPGGPGMPVGGAAGSYMKKASSANYDTLWSAVSAADVTGALGYTPPPATRQVLAGSGLTGGGDISADRTISMPSVGVSGTYGDAGHYPVVTTDVQGRVSGVALQPVAPGGVTSFNTRLGAVALTTADVTGALGYTPVPPTRQVLAGSGLSGGGALSADTTLSLPGVGTSGTYGDSTHYPVLTTDPQGRLSAVALQALPPALPPGWVNVKDLAYGAKGDLKGVVAGGTVTAGSTTLTTSAQFVPTDVGKTIMVRGAGAAGADLLTTIAGYVSAGQITLATTASTTLASLTVVWGTDDTAAVQAAVNTLKGTGFKGGTVYFPPGQYLHTGTLDLSTCGGICLQGPTGIGSASTYKPTASLIYVGSGARFIDMGQSYGCAIRHLGVLYCSASFTGHLVDCLGAGGQAGTAYLVYEHSLFYGWAPSGVYPTSAGSALNLSGANKVSVRECYIGCAAAGVRGAPDGGVGYNTNGIQVYGCNFDSCTLGGIVNMEQSWVVLGNCFEGTAVQGLGHALKRAVYDNHANIQILGGLTFSGNWCGDPSSDIVEWVSNGPNPWYGVVIQGNFFSGAPYSLNLQGGGGSFAISGNTFGSSTADIVLPAAKVVNAGYICGNRFSTNPATQNLFRPHQQFVCFGNFTNALNQGATTDLMPVYGHLVLTHNPQNAAPTVASLFGTAGTGATLAVTGSDTAGQISLTTGTGPAAGNLFKLNYQQSYQNNDNLVTTLPRIYLTPANAAAVGVQVWPNLNSAYDSWYMVAVNALAASTTYLWNYLVVG